MNCNRNRFLVMIQSQMNGKNSNTKLQINEQKIDENKTGGIHEEFVNNLVETIILYSIIVLYI